MIAHVQKATRDGREVHRLEYSHAAVPVVDGRSGKGREVIGQAWVRPADDGTGVIATCTIYDDAVAALLAPGTPLRLVAEMVGEVTAAEPEEYALRVFTEPETRPFPRWRLVGELRGVAMTEVPAWDDLWVREES